MCGICGVISRDPQGDVEAVNAMSDSLTHRGPDGEGRFDVAHLHMAMRRLSIIDLNSGWQPLYNEDHSIAVIANGEIYNYVELRDELQKRGHSLATKSDIETIAHLYEDYGLDCVKHLRGMFAFALWDSKQNRLMLARDRIGEKPLYLYQSDDALYFASELRTLTQTRKIRFELDPAAIQLYFHYGYVPEPLTPIAAVRKLPAGHLLVVDVRSWQIEEHTYWSIDDIPPLSGDPVKLIREQLDELSALVIRSDVPVGVALSGGLDSSAIAALTARTYPGVLQAFSVGYPGRPNHDEREQARSLAQSLKIPFHEVELSTEEHTEFFEELVYLRDDPIADISGLGYYSVSKKAREMGVPVLLQGQGGDELFWGYEWVSRAARQTLRKQKYLSGGYFKELDYLNSMLPPGFSPGKLWGWAKNGFGIPEALRTHYRDSHHHHDDMVFMELAPDFVAAYAEMPSMYTSDFFEKIKGFPPESLHRIKHPWTDVPVALTKLIMQTYLLENGIAQGDRLAMANSVELRLPLVDYRLIETVVGLRRTYPDHALPPKYWFKQALKDILPQNILSRRKQGFAPPIRKWHNDIFLHYGKKLMDGYLVQEKILTPQAAANLATGPYPDVVVPSSFKALVLELWARRVAP